MKVMEFEKANEYIKGKINVPTDMSSLELAMSDEFNASVKVHSFFSARVSSANVLERLRQEVEEYFEGRTDLATARLRLKTFLQRQGVAFPDDVSDQTEPPEGMDEDEWKARKKISNLASTRRLDLILKTNAKQAFAAGRYNTSMHPDIMARFPNFKYDALGDARTTHAAFDGLVLPKTDAFWATHTPPWEFNCRCAIYDSDEQANAKTAQIDPDKQIGKIDYNGTAIELLPNDSGYTFRIDKAFEKLDASMIQNLNLRKKIVAEVADLANALSAKIEVNDTPDDYKINEFEKKHRLQKFESCLVTDGNGKVLLEKDGEQYKIEFTKEEERLIRGGRFTHNHPRGLEVPENDPRRAGNSFSPDDIKTACTLEFMEMRAVTPLRTFIMQPPDGGWNEKFYTTKIEPEYDKASKQVEREFKKKIKENKMTVEQAEADHFDQVWKKVSLKLKLKYKKLEG